jgi:hypothetical protein
MRYIYIVDNFNFSIEIIKYRRIIKSKDDYDILYLPFSARIISDIELKSLEASFECFGYDDIFEKYRNKFKQGYVLNSKQLVFHTKDHAENFCNLKKKEKLIKEVIE